MSVIKNSEALQKFSKNDWFEYRQVCKHIKDMAKHYEKNVENINIPDTFFADFAFNTSETALFFNIKAKFITKKRFRKKRIFFTIVEIIEISSDDYLDIISEVKEIFYGEKE